MKTRINLSVEVDLWKAFQASHFGQASSMFEELLREVLDAPAQASDDNIDKLKKEKLSIDAQLTDLRTKSITYASKIKIMEEQRQKEEQRKLTEEIEMKQAMARSID